MNQKDINQRAFETQALAHEVLDASGIIDVWRRYGCRVNLVGSLRMGLLAVHRDIDLHVYSEHITLASSFAIMAEIAENPAVMEIKCINGLRTDEHCVAWHLMYKHTDSTVWQIDIIHIEANTVYDGYFERMADRINEVMTPAQRDTILRLKSMTPDGADYHGVEYYEAVIADGVSSMDEFSEWVMQHRKKPLYYWIP